MQIAIDGPAGAGKSTIAKILAKDLKYIYVDTGAMYRAISLYFYEKKIKSTDIDMIISELSNVHIELVYVDYNQKIFLNDRDVTEEIRKPLVSKLASEYSKIQVIREKLVNMQQEIAKNNDVIMDGRDIASKVLPFADLKIYLDANVEVRAKRRFLEQGDLNQTFEEIVEDIKQRDYEDKTRDNSPLIKVDDAKVIDSTSYTIEEVVEQIKKYIN